MKQLCKSKAIFVSYTYRLFIDAFGLRYQAENPRLNQASVCG
ncbi:hypothetical protein LLB_2213 [Legionella longbeachae D-4968]|nr:hypothetical protein LLB_2213 [Legionella longbeachae D-4968]